MEWKMEVDGIFASGSCILRSGTGSAPDGLAVALAGTKATIACPATLAGQNDYPYIILALGSIANLEPAFSFTKENIHNFEVEAGLGMKHQRSLRQNQETLQEIAVNGTWDRTSRRLSGTITGVWEGTPATAEGRSVSNGKVEIRFNVIVPTTNS